MAGLTSIVTWKQMVGVGSFFRDEKTGLSTSIEIGLTIKWGLAI